MIREASAPVRAGAGPTCRVSPRLSDQGDTPRSCRASRTRFVAVAARSETTLRPGRLGCVRSVAASEPVRRERYHHRRQPGRPLLRPPANRAELLNRRMSARSRRRARNQVVRSRGVARRTNGARSASCAAPCVDRRNYLAAYSSSRPSLAVMAVVKPLCAAFARAPNRAAPGGEQVYECSLTTQF
jgi:hypothetical protein